jgi:hypothetical protein
VTAARGYTAEVVTDRRDAVWERLVQRAEQDACGIPSGAGSWERSVLSRRAHLQLTIVAGALAMAVTLGGWWWAERTDGQPDPDVSAELALWDRQPLMEDPMGPTTERLLALMEAER